MKIQDADSEIKRFEDAKEEAKKQLQELHDKALKEVGEANAEIFEVHQMMTEITSILSPTLLPAS